MGSADPPKQLGSFELLGLLATGGMAEVFLARRCGPSPSGFVDREPLVIKRVLPHLARQPTFHDMFLDEARIVSRIRHPNVVSVHELVDGDGELFLVMEFLEGESLATLLRQLRKTQATLPLDLAVHLGMQAASGLHAAHELKNEAGRSLDIVHRDVSPHNLFVLYAGHLKVIDFGIAKAAERQASQTQTGQVKGKFAYMPPEQIGAQQVDRRADVFALGIVLHELLTGQKLFERDHELLVLKAICEDPIPPPSAKRPDVPAALDAIVMKALARSRDKRYATAEELRADLERALDAPGVARAGGADPSTRLSAMMHTLFEQRVSRQHELLAKLRAGAAVAAPPPRASSPNSDAMLLAPMHGVDSSPPTRLDRSDHVGQSITITPQDPVRAEEGRRSSRRWAVFGGAAVAGVAGVTIAVMASGGGDRASDRGGASSAAAAPAPPLPSSSVAASASVAPAAATTASAAPSAPAASASSTAPRPLQPPTTAPQTPAFVAPTAQPPKPKPTSTGFTRFE